MVLLLHLCVLLVKPPDSLEHFVEHLHGDPVLHHLEDPQRLGRRPELSYYVGAMRVGQIDDRNDVIVADGGGGGIMCSWVDEDAWDFGGAGVDEAFDACFGVVEGLELAGAVVDGHGDGEIEKTERAL